MRKYYEFLSQPTRVAEMPVSDTLTSTLLALLALLAQSSSKYVVDLIKYTRNNGLVRAGGGIFQSLGPSPPC
ncbi:hypothetical protein F5Y18DRAFT_333717 [Xylariaceae sp. FL1019]|nr:hypothetical protein F5Y18DRAFT_333717 [Xylariaceae sp. FL1019]